MTYDFKGHVKIVEIYMLKFNVSILNNLKLIALRKKCPKTEFNLNTGKCGPEKLRIWALFTPCGIFCK